MMCSMNQLYFRLNLIFLGDSSLCSHGFPMVFLWFSYGFPSSSTVFLWFSYGFLIFLRFPHGFFPWVSTKVWRQRPRHSSAPLRFDPGLYPWLEGLSLWFINVFMKPVNIDVSHDIEHYDIILYSVRAYLIKNCLCP